MPHVSTIFIEIIKLYTRAMDTESIPKERLEEVFKVFIDILEEATNSSIYYDYADELSKFLSLHSGVFKETKSSLTWEQDIEEIYSNYIKNNRLTDLDFQIAELVLNVDIYEALDIKIKKEIIAPFFDSNRLLMQAFTKVAYEDYTKAPLSLDDLKQKREDFLSLFDDLDNPTLIKLRIAHHIFDFQYGSHLSDYKFFPWWIILFSEYEQEWQLITYNTIATMCEDFDEILDSDDEELQAGYFETEEESLILNTYEIFLKIFIIYLDKFLSCISDFPGRQTFIAKKYLLLSLPELGDTLEHLFENKNLDSISIEDTEYEINDQELINIYLECLDCITLLRKNNLELNKNPGFYATMVLAAIFIKSFLKIASTDYQKKVTDLLTNPEYYKNPLYQTYNDILDNILFNNNFNLTR